ncbi:MAG: hypothetical protein OQK92_01155 [Sedimenticola sp.]|uniref:Lipoprotein n=1 Tax=Sedimenticola thiotaurini TaxID=1543721 RepID=A0A558D0C3_9GAMM|nr:hypothetical protein [Sedimenticola sp.]MCW8921641.1 hypothetical protein [Sedimenticola sp.]MCW8947881.1 hypothetical protein [Sedimenticola sp.]TVT54469.1 MAG: hypothetical protein FHK82_09710 [Sedimenticola thiotaurini]
MKGSSVLCLMMVAMLLAGCNSTPDRNSPIKTRQFQMGDIAKSDVDMVAEIQLRYSMEYLKELMEKLYRRNPHEWPKGGAESIALAVDRVFGKNRNGLFPELLGKRGSDSITLAFDPVYNGDRVLAFVEGLRGMILQAHNGKQEFYLTDELDPQKLYNAARNIEIATWKLSHDRDSYGRLFLISNATKGPVSNLSYERLFGKLIALQDSMARIVAQSSNRRIKTIIQSVASAVFMPI